jgi:hypothetical protein
VYKTQEVIQYGYVIKWFFEMVVWRNSLCAFLDFRAVVRWWCFQFPGCMYIFGAVSPMWGVGVCWLMVTLDGRNCVGRYGYFLDACVPAIVFLVSVHWYPQTVKAFHVLRLSGVGIPVAMSVLWVFELMVFPGYV